MPEFKGNKGFKMKGFQPHSDSPMVKGPITWLKNKAKQGKEWFDESIVETIRTGKDPSQRWVEGQKYNRLLDPRNKTPEGLKAKKDYADKKKKSKAKKDFAKHGVQGMLGGTDKKSHMAK
jgi:hypothetical protein